MRLTLLGTATADGWPNPFCTCASCNAARARGEARGPTSVLVGASLLLDCGPDMPRAAGRLGLDLAGVRHLLLTHADPDVAAAAARWRASAGAERLDVVAPPSVAAAWRGRASPGDPVVVRAAAPGVRLALPGFGVRTLAAGRDGDELGYDVTDEAGTRLLYAAGTGPLPDATLAAVGDAAYDVVLLGAAGAGPRATFPAQLAELRRSGAVTSGTTVVAVHLGHDNPPPDELGRRLRLWGARLLADGTELRVGPGAAEEPAPRPPLRVLVLGGARSGKSAEAERRLAADPEVTYVATARDRPEDPEWQQRVAAHRARRPGHWRTVETRDVEAVLAGPPGGTPVLIDCLTLWLADVLETAADPDGRVAALVAAWRTTAVRVVAVSNEVGSCVVPPTAAGRRFRDLLGTLNAGLAAASDEVWLVTAGIPRRLR